MCKLKLGLIHGCKTKIILYVLTWDDRIEAYIQSVTLKKTLESVSMEYRRGGDLILAENERNENLHTK
ncbi:hypothetical protein NAPIS_ORF01835 [Vairimorpha apis BRL 01]|uniref:Uncharacterized protein n=1 Tax=Vairimorpha apis BRL 01 TaxID=1037528 RepID=T0MHZ3_9MICR|nr:hypothetical protein NAPIS_ORF01835 [Vairimorpha apis BRL 01]